MITDYAKDDHETKTQFNVLLIEDNPTDALLVKSHIEKFAGFGLHIVETLAQALDTLNCQSFDLILLDLNLPDALGLEGLVKLQHHGQKVPVVVLTGVDNEELGIMALQRGAQDYLIKGVDNHRLAKAIRYAIERVLVHGSDSSMVSQLYLDINRTSPHSSARSPMGIKQNMKERDVLTERELQVLKLLGTGCNNQEIAERLLLSVNTIKTHIANVLHKLSVSDRAKAIVEAQRRGLI